VQNRWKSCGYPRRKTWGKVFGHHSNFRHIVHLVRDPLKNIDSRFNGGAPGRNSGFQAGTNCNTVALERLRPGLSNYNATLVATLRHWVLWNSFVQYIAASKLSQVHTE